MLTGRTTFIYALVDPRTDGVRYVGKANDPAARFKNHRNDRGSTRRARWFAALEREGVQPSIVVLEEVAVETWQDAERRWISTYRAAGADLTNHTDGGEGLLNATEDTKAKLAEIRRKEWANPETRAVRMATLTSESRRAKISKGLTGKKKSPEHVARLPQNRPGRRLSPEHLAKSIETLKRIHRDKLIPYGPLSEERRTALRLSSLGNRARTGMKNSPESNRLRSLAGKGVPKSEEHKERIRQGALRRWARARSKTETGEGEKDHDSVQ